MVVIFTVDVNNEIIQMKYLLKRDHVCTRMKLGLVQSPAYNIDTVFYGLESWTGVLEWNLGGKFLSGADRRNLLPTPVAFPILFFKETN